MSISVTFTAENKEKLYTTIGEYLGIKVASTTTQTTTRAATAPAVNADAEAETARAGKKGKEKEDFDLGFESNETETAKETTLDEVIDAFKVYAAATSRESAAKVLKSFKAKSVRDLKSEQYGKVLETLNAGI